MRRIGGLWASLTSMDNLREAAQRACRPRSYPDEVTSFQEDAEGNLERLRESLVGGFYASSEYRMFTIDERGKQRLVADLPLYPDRIAHWAICLALEGPLNRKLIDQAYGSRPGTGHHKAVRQLSEYISNDSRIRYALFVDIHHFFPSIDKDVLKQKLSAAVKDHEVVRLLDRIIDDYPLSGIPIGNRTSPMLANLYLSSMDHAMKEKHHCHYYVRYMDDIVVLGYSKPWLHRIRTVISDILSEIGLTIKGNWQVFPIDSRGIPYLGYRVFSDHVLLKKDTKVRMKRAAERISARLEDPEYVMDTHDLGTYHSYEGVLRWCDGINLERKVLKPLMEANKANIEHNKRKNI